ncbi:hypothetical protein MAR_021520 [Mya arenaria]|uniref:Secreted protein n=1 Tax=Mya arenaria TaxID=6604 RepID=A0ABY7EBW2_MYAAR|nr:hypothetical protein MAR_021520 [Mya arenaria]
MFFRQKRVKLAVANVLCAAIALCVSLLVGHVTSTSVRQRKRLPPLLAKIVAMTCYSTQGDGLLKPPSRPENAPTTGDETCTLFSHNNAKTSNNPVAYNENEN